MKSPCFVNVCVNKQNFVLLFVAAVMFSSNRWLATAVSSVSIIIGSRCRGIMQSKLLEVVISMRSV